MSRRAAVLVALALGGPLPAHAASLFVDDVAVRSDGELRILYEHALEPDADGTVLPGSVNHVAPRLRLAPELWVNEFVAVRTLVDLNGPAAAWGAGAARYPGLSGDAPALDLRVGRASLYWQTPLGTVDVGRLGWHWGLGLFQHDGRTDLDRYGVPDGTGAMDMVKVGFAPLGIHVPLDMHVFLQTFFQGANSGTGFADLGLGYGVAAEYLPERGAVGVLARYDNHHDGGTELWWIDGYGRVRLGIAELGGEGGLRAGRSATVWRVSPSDFSVAPRHGQWLSGGGVAHVKFPGWRSGKVSFAATGLEAGALSGDDLAQAATARDWSDLRAARDYHVGLVLFSKLWEARRAALTALQRDAFVARAGGYADELNETFAARSGDGVGNAWFVMPGFGLRTDQDLRFRLNVLYAQALSPLPTLHVADNGGTAQRADDRYDHERSYGFEIDLHLSYPFWGGVAGVLEAGLAFPGGAFDDARGDGAPISFLLAPRLTASF